MAEEAAPSHLTGLSSTEDEGVKTASKTEDDEWNLTALFCIGLTANLGSFLFGYDFGATSWLLVNITSLALATTETSTGTNYYQVVVESSGLTGLIAAGASIGALATYSVLLFSGNAILKKDEIMLSAFLFFVGALLESTSGAVGWTDGDATGLALLICGRLVYGAGIASSFHAVPAYISELGPKQLRGMVGSLTEALIVTGVVVGFLVGWLYEDLGWVVPFRVAYSIAILMGLLALFLPHAPSGMIRAGYSSEDVLESMRYIHPGATEVHVHELFARREEEKMEAQRWEKHFEHQSAVRSDVGSDESQAQCCDPSLEVKVLFSDPIQQRCLLLALLLVVIQIGTGQGVILYYSGTIFDEICPDDYNSCLLGFGGVKLASAYLMVGVADMLGRREFLIYGTFVMFLGMLLLTVGYAQEQLELAVSGLYISVAGYEAGLGSFMWILLSEIFPRFTRSSANSIAVSVLFLCSTILTFTLPFFLAASGLVPIFSLFVVVSGLAVVLLFLYVPETGGVELEEAYKLVDERCRASGVCCLGDSGSPEDPVFDETSKHLL